MLFQYACLLKTITEALSIDKVINKVPTLMEQARNSDKKLLNLQRQNACQEIQMELHKIGDKMADYESTVRRYDIELTRLRFFWRIIFMKNRRCLQFIFLSCTLGT